MRQNDSLNLKSIFEGSSKLSRFFGLQYHNKIIGIAAFAGFFFQLFLSPVRGQVSGNPSEFASRLAAVEDPSLRLTLSKSIAVGLIKDAREFDSALSIGMARAIRDNPAVFSTRSFYQLNKSVGEEISRLAAPISGLDRDSLKNVSMNNNGAGNLFNPISEKIPASYESTYNLAGLFNPKVGTNDAQSLEKEIDRYFQTLSDDPVIKYSLQCTKTSIGDLKRNWFGPGMAFEHIIAGEYKGNEVSGYHWWYKFYRDEQKGGTKYLKTLQANGSKKIFTGQFSWDPDLSGPIPVKMKKKGGFTVGHSPQALLALGHIAIETAKKNGNVPVGITFKAGINGETYTWQVYTVGGSLRSLFPMAAKSGSEDVTPGSYFAEEEDVLKSATLDEKPSVH